MIDGKNDALPAGDGLVDVHEAFDRRDPGDFLLTECRDLDGTEAVGTQCHEMLPGQSSGTASGTHCARDIFAGQSAVTGQDRPAEPAECPAQRKTDRQGKRTDQ